jgi:hypothetical protein
VQSHESAPIVLVVLLVRHCECLRACYAPNAAVLCRLDSDLRTICNDPRPAARIGATVASDARSVPYTLPCAASALQHRFDSGAAGIQFEQLLAGYHARIVRLLLMKGWWQQAFEYIARVPASSASVHGACIHEVKKHGDMECLREGLRLHSLLGVQMNKCAPLDTGHTVCSKTVDMRPVSCALHVRLRLLTSCCNPARSVVCGATVHVINAER